MKSYFEAAQLITPRGVVEHARVVIEDGRFAQVGTRADLEFPAAAQVNDLGESILAPGFIDIHIHGSGGHDVMEATPQGLLTVERALARHGVTSYLATTVTAPIAQTLEAVEKLGRWVEADQDPAGRAVALGLHLEGPFISHAKRGVHPPAHLQAPSIELFDRMQQAASGRVRLMTVAPEGEGAGAMIAHAVGKGVRVSVGHSDATFRQTRDAIAAGASHATHTFNAMRGLDHREPGILGAVLADEGLSAEIIADGVHVHPEMVKMFVRLKGAERAILVTDAISATGMGDGTFQLGGFQVEVRGDRCEFEGRLAGSVLTLDRAVRNTMKFASVALSSAVRMVSFNPAQLLGIEDRGVIQAGAIADLNVLRPDGEIVRTLHAGR